MSFLLLIPVLGVYQNADYTDAGNMREIFPMTDWGLPFRILTEPLLEHIDTT